jgi:hypothetical protein
VNISKALARASAGLALMLLAASAFASVNVTNPSPGTRVASPVQYTATATTSTCTKGVASMGVYVENKLVYVTDAASLNSQIAMSSGAEHTVVEEWDKCGGSTFTTINLTVTNTTTPPPAGNVDIPTWHMDSNRSGLNAKETALTLTNVNSEEFGKRFSILVDGYAYAEPLLMSNITINGSVHNVLYVATESDQVYAFDSDTGASLWHRVLGTPMSDGDIKPFQGVTSTPVIDPATNTMYVVSAHSGGTFHLNALNILTGAQKSGAPITIHASVRATNSAAVNGVQTLNTSCVQRSALLLANGNVYFGFGGCHTGWLLAYDATTLAQVGVFNASPKLNGEGEWASAGGVWMGGGGAAADSAGNVYITTGNGPWDGLTAFSDSVLKFSPALQLEDYFTPDDYQYMDCADGDLASGGLLLIPGTTTAVAGGKTGKMYLVDTTNLGKEQANDAGAVQTLFYEGDLSAPFAKSCTDALGNHSTLVSAYEIYGTSAYFNGSVYLGIMPFNKGIPGGIRRFIYDGNLTPSSYSSPPSPYESRGTTPFISANGTANGIVWMIDQGLPLGNSSGEPTVAILRAYNAANLSEELYNSSANSTDIPGYGIKFSSPVVGNGKVYISTGHDLTTATNPQGEINVYGLK